MKLDTIISFDTTSYMYNCMLKLKKEANDIFDKLFSEFKDLQIGIITHGDYSVYCNEDVSKKPYIINTLELSRDIDVIRTFLDGSKHTQDIGGTSEECYELVLKRAGTFNWRADAKKILIMIGDASPHSAEFKDKIDWKAEAVKLKQNNIHVYAVHALASIRKDSKKFYQKVAEETFGKYIPLYQLDEATNIIKAIIYNQYGKVDDFIKKLKSANEYTITMNNAVKAMTSSCKLLNEDQCKFQVVHVDEEDKIMHFISKTDIYFWSRKLIMHEVTTDKIVSESQEVILQNKKTGEIISGDKVKKHYSIQNKDKTLSDKFRIFTYLSGVTKFSADTNFIYRIHDETTVKKDIGNNEQKQVDFIEINSSVDIIHATNQELDDMLKGKPNTLTEKLNSESFMAGQIVDKQSKSKDKQTHEVAQAHEAEQKHELIEQERAEIHNIIDTYIDKEIRKIVHNSDEHIVENKMAKLKQFLQLFYCN